jgi:hypothetical protein
MPILPSSAAARGRAHLRHRLGALAMSGGVVALALMLVFLAENDAGAR